MEKLSGLLVSDQPIDRICSRPTGEKGNHFTFLIPITGQVRFLGLRVCSRDHT